MAKREEKTLLNNSNSKKEQISAKKLFADKYKIEAILESMGDGFFITDSDGKIIFINESAKKFAKPKISKLVGNFYGDVFFLMKKDGSSINNGEDPLAKVVENNESIDRDDLVLKVKSKFVYISFYASPILDNSKKVIGTIVIIRDISKEKKIERMRHEFVSIASHELATPIAAISGHLSMILDEGIGKIDKDTKEILSGAYESSKRLSRLVKDLLNMSRLEEGKIIVDLKPVDICELIDDIIFELEPLAKQSNLYLRFTKTGRKIPKALADPIKIREVIVNLINNAFKFTKKGGITLSCEEKNNFIVINVSDTGIGIEKSDIPYLFQKFHQIDVSDRIKTQGTGLGLYISRKIIEMHKGEILVNSKVGKGSVFSFTLPVALR